MKKISIFFIIVIFISYFSCRSTPLIIDYMPRIAEVPGWSLTYRKFYKNKKDIEKNNKLYYQNGVTELAIQSYGPISGDSSEIKIEILKFKTPLDAFGLYSEERGFDESNKQIDMDSYISIYGLFFRKGEYYVKLLSTNINDGLKKTLMEFQSIIAGNLEPYYSKEPLPNYISLLSSNYSNSNLIYYKNGHELLPDLKNIFVRKRNIFEKTRLIFFIKTPGEDDALKQYNALLNSKNRKFILTKVENLTVSFKNVNNKYLFIAVYNDYIFGILNAENINDGNTIIMKLFEEIKAAVDK